MVLLILALLTEGVALAGAGWFLHAPDSDLDAAVDVPLYRGEIGDYRPLVHVSFGEDRPDTSALAVLDLGGEWTRIGADLARGLQLRTNNTKVHGKEIRRALIDEVVIGDLTLRGVRAEVVPGDELILGLGAAGHLGIGILPSAGVVRFVPPTEIEGLLRVAGGTLPAFGQSTARWMEHGKPRHGNGLSLAAPILLDSEPSGAWIRTDWDQTRLIDTGELADIELGENVMTVRPIVDESLGDPAADFVGGLGYDLLYAYDLVLSPREDLMAVQFVEDPKWEDPAPVAVAIAKLRHEMWKEAAEADEKGASGRPKIGFEAQTQTSTIAGDPGDQAAGDQYAALANTLWIGGDPDGAVQASLAATGFAGDRCEPYLTLGIRRMRTSGALQKKSFVAKLVVDPLERAGELWDAWASMDPSAREDVRAGKGLDALTFQLPQPGVCRDAWGHYALALIAQGKGEKVLELKPANRGLDRQYALASGLASLQVEDAESAEASIRRAMGMGGRGDIRIRFALAAARVAQGKPIPHLAVDPDRSDAVLLALAARALAPVKAPAETIPEALAAAIYGEGTTSGIATRLEEARKRRAGSPEVACQMAILLAITGEAESAAEVLRTARSASHRVADYWVAKAIIALAVWDLEEAGAALTELKMRFPATPSRIAR